MNYTVASNFVGLIIKIADPARMGIITPLEAAQLAAALSQGILPEQSRAIAAALEDRGMTVDDFRECLTAATYLAGLSRISKPGTDSGPASGISGTGTCAKKDRERRAHFSEITS